jgi:hypothetical protein
MSEKWDDEFEDVFRERLSDFEAEPPAEAWANIAAQVQPARPWWKNWYYYLPIMASLVIISPQTTVDSPQKNANTGESPQTTVDSPQKNANTGESPQSTVDSPQKNANTGESPQSTVDSPQKNANTGESPQTTVDSPQKNANTGESPQSTVDSPQTTVDRRLSTANNPQKNTDSKLNRNKNAEIADNQVNTQTTVDSPQTTVDRRLSTANNPQKNTDSKLNRNKNAEVTDNRLIRDFFVINLLSRKESLIQTTENTLANQAIENMAINLPKPRFRPPLWLSFTASPLYTFRTILPNEGDSLVITRFAPQNSFSRQATGFALNFTLEKSINQRLTIFGGANMLQAKTADALSYYNQENVSYTVIRSDSARIIVQPNFNSISATQRSTYQNLALTLGLKYHLGGQRIRQSVALGGGYNWLINEKFNTNELKTKDIQKHNILLTLSYEFDYQVNTRWRLRFAPTAIYYLQPWFQNTAIYQTRPYHLSFQLGASYRLK